MPGLFPKGKWDNISQRGPIDPTSRVTVHVLVIIPNLSQTSSYFALDKKLQTYLILGHPENFWFDNCTLRTK